MKKRDCTIYVVKTKALISCAVTTQLICVFVFAYAKSRFSHNEAHLWHVSAGQLCIHIKYIIFKLITIVTYVPHFVWSHFIIPFSNFSHFRIRFIMFVSSFQAVNLSLGKCNTE